MEQAPPDVFEEAATQVQKNTTLHLFPLWFQNWADNLASARFGDSLDKLYSRPPSERVLVVGRGPSLLKRGHLELLKKHPFKGHIVASDGALPLLAERDIIPYCSVTVDGNPIIAKWFDGPTARFGSKVNAVLPLTVSPKAAQQVRKIGGHIYWYIPELDHDDVKGLTEILQLQTLSPRNPTGISRHNGAGNCGLSAIVFAATILRTKEIVLIGMDGGYHLDTPLEELHYHKNMMKSMGYKEAEVAKLYRVYNDPLLGYSIVDVVFETYRKVFLMLAKQLVAAGIRVINATEGGCLSTDGVEIAKFEDYLTR